MTIKERRRINSELILLDALICSKCEEPKRLEEFHVNKSAKYGRQAKCISCISELQKTKAYKEKLDERVKKYKEEGRVNKWNIKSKNEFEKSYSSFLKTLKRDLIELGFKQVKQNQAFFIDEKGIILKIPSKKTYRELNRPNGINEIPYKYLYVNVSKNKYGYLRFCMNSKLYRVHQIVAQEFLGHVMQGHKVVVDHIDGNKLNNNVDNLQLTTNYENLAKGWYYKTKEDKWLRFIKNIKH